MFQSFRLHLSTGMVVDIGSPEFTMLGRSILWIESPGHVVPLARRRIAISLSHIVWLEFIDDVAQAGLN
ncbi:MAG TPA: hypothetical protein PK867_31020 [Pirellulales bacterium]|nr:hypothetical protein [Pirellulales bacterium]